MSRENGQLKKPVIAFLWRHEEMTRQVLDMSQKTGTRAIFDFSAYISFKNCSGSLETANKQGVTDIFLLSPLIEDEDFRTFLTASEIRNIWLEIHPRFWNGHLSSFLEAVVKLSDACDIFPVLGHVPWVFEILAGEKSGRIQNIVLKGNEASGFVGSETTMTLYSAATDMLGDTDPSKNIYIWGGVGTPEAAGAFLASGAAGLVFESLHWLTDLVPIEDETRQRIKRLKPEHTELIDGENKVFCRLYNKGNSKAIKALKTANDSGGAEKPEKGKDPFVKEIQDTWIHPLLCRFSSHQLIPIGVEAGFAEGFVDRYGTKTEQALDAFMRDLKTETAKKQMQSERWLNHPFADELGTRYPFIQGAMSWITDVPEFARSVFEAGGLPTVALGMLHGDGLKKTLAKLREVMGRSPYAVNFVALPENPYMDEQIRCIKEHCPPFVVIAAGEPTISRVFRRRGMEVFFLAPDEAMVKLAFDSGVRYVICEGNEAGGHVGRHSTLTLSQLVLEQKRRDPALFDNKKIVLAGGIFNRMTALMAASLGADGVQLGTAYLATEEIVQSGALSRLYQNSILASEPGDTVVTGVRQGLGIRAIKNAKTREIASIERDSDRNGKSAKAIRKEIEGISAGSLQIAARGLARGGKGPPDQKTCLKEGHFMSGACAGAIHRVISLEGLHEELAGAGKDKSEANGSINANGSSAHTVDDGLKIPQVLTETGRINHRVAITGMSIFNSLGNGLKELWGGTLGMKSGVKPVPRSRWDHGLYYDPRPHTPNKTYSSVGAFHGLRIDRKELGIAPHDFRTMSNATKMTLWLAEQLVSDSGILGSSISKERIGVITSQNSGEAAGTLADILIGGEIEPILAKVRKKMPLAPEVETALIEQIMADRISVDDTTLLGRLNSAAAGFICAKYGFKGPGFAISAACASSLTAVHTAVQMIRGGIIDAALVGGAEEPLMPMHFVEFAALGVLSGMADTKRAPAGMSRPFDAGRDGMVLGEGGGMVLLEKEAGARKRGARIHGFITGIGANNSPTGLIESSHETQEMAIRASFEDAGYGPRGVDLVECHATGTPQGDKEEVQALKTFYGKGKPTAITSFKSQIGHTLGASGINSLIRGMLAMEAGMLPASINCENPDPALGLQGSALLIPASPMAWPTGKGGPRRIQVNAFGFGGANYVVQIEQFLKGNQEKPVGAEGTCAPESRGNAHIPLQQNISFYRTRIGHDPYRLAILSQNEKEALEDLKGFLGVHQPPFKGKQEDLLARKGIYLGSEKEAPSSLAFIFPGQGSHYAGMGRELYETFPVIRKRMDLAAAMSDFDLLNLMFFGEEDVLKESWVQQPALFALECGIADQLTAMGAKPSVVAGHSVGEMAALWAAGVYSFEDGFHLVMNRARCMKKAAEQNKDPGAMIAVHAGIDRIEQLISGRCGLWIANINSPGQVVLSGETPAISHLRSEMKRLNIRFTVLKVSMAFHTPMMKPVLDEFAQSISGIPLKGPGIPVISNTTGMPYPSETTAIRESIVRQMELPVHWMKGISRIREDYGIRCFVETGPKRVLGNLMLDTITDGIQIPTCLPKWEKKACCAAVAKLFASGCLRLPQAPPSLSLWERENVDAKAVVGREVVERTFEQGKRTKRTLEKTIQQGINSFILDTYGRFLKPLLLETVRKQWDPSFTEAQLEKAIHDMGFGGQRQLPTFGTSQGMRESATGSAASAAKKEDREYPPVEAGFFEENMLESIIKIIMDATGYERDEIHEDMDLRDDLGIRSSRLPVILDALEKRSGVNIELSQFVHARTVREIAGELKKIGQREKAGSADGPEPLAQREETKRFVFSRVPLKASATKDFPIEKEDSVHILRIGKGDGARDLIENFFKRDRSLFTNFQRLQGMKWPFQLGSLSQKGEPTSVKKLRSSPSACGVILDMTGEYKETRNPEDGLPKVMEQVFFVVKAFMEMPRKKFVLLLHEGKGLMRILADGVLGMFLSCAHEYPSLLFRTMRLDRRADTAKALDDAMNKEGTAVETIYRDGKGFTLEGFQQPLVFEESGEGPLSPGKVVVLSGGGAGITSHIARAVGSFGIRAILLGRTNIDSEYDLSPALLKEGNPEGTVSKMVAEKHPDMPQEALSKEIRRLLRALEISKTLKRLNDCGIDAAYYACDVTRKVEVRDVFQKIRDRYGEINGIVHGAGIIQDGLLRDMTPEDFRSVMAVKFRGALNLFRAARKDDLRFFTCLSSLVSFAGNMGQANYAAGNRMMAALCNHLAGENPSIRFRTLALPPVEGAGMAEDDWIRKRMEEIGIAYIHVNEISELFLREHCLNRSQNSNVMLAKTAPRFGTTHLNWEEPTVDPEAFSAGGLVFRKRDFPMIDGVSWVDHKPGSLKAYRLFSHKKDQWLKDHKPSKTMPHPVLSGIMLIETLLEGARILYPHLMPKRVQEVHFLDMIVVPKGAERLMTISCHRRHWDDATLACGCALSAGSDVTGNPMGRPMDRCVARVFLGPVSASGTEETAQMFPRDEALETSPVEHLDIPDFYQRHSDLTGRYRLETGIHGMAPRGIKGWMIYREGDDFHHLKGASYQYSPYLLEASFHMPLFHSFIRQGPTFFGMLPVGIREMVLGRKCREGEKITLHARMTSETKNGSSWDVQAQSETGEALLTVKGLKMQTFSP